MSAASCLSLKAARVLEGLVDLPRVSLLQEILLLYDGADCTFKSGECH
jgi:hypothetical protein